MQDLQEDYGVLEEKQKCDEQVKGVGMERKLTTERLKKVWTESERSGERLLQAARRVSAANQLTEFSELQA